MKLTFITFLFLFCELTYSQTDSFTAKVVGVKDGDTIEVLNDKKLNFVIRLAEIDCPEKGQSYGQKAKQATSDLVFGKFVEVEITDTDRWGRYIGKVYVEDKYLSAELIKMGLAWVYRRYSNNEYLIELENEAKKNKVGLWIEPNPTPPWEWRKQ